jgi:hypothetical protein
MCGQESGRTHDEALARVLDLDPQQAEFDGLQL